MEQHQHYPNMSILFNFLSRIGSLSDRRMFDDVISNMMGVRSGVGTYGPVSDLTSAYMGSAALVAYDSGDRDSGAVFNVPAGIGFKRDNSQSDTDQARLLPIQIDADFTFTVAASGAGDRVDSYFLRPLFASGNPQSVPIIDPADDTITSESRDIDKSYIYEAALAQGTDGVTSPTAPPGNYLEADRVCDITIRAGSGTVDAIDIADTRKLLRLNGDHIAGLALGVDVNPSVLASSNVQGALEALASSLSGINIQHFDTLPGATNMLQGWIITIGLVKLGIVVGRDPDPAAGQQINLPFGFDTTRAGLWTSFTPARIDNNSEGGIFWVSSTAINVSGIASEDYYFGAIGVAL